MQQHILILFILTILNTYEIYFILFMKSVNMNDNSCRLSEEENFSSCNTSKVKLLNFKYHICFVLGFFSGI